MTDGAGTKKGNGSSGRKSRRRRRTSSSTRTVDSTTANDDEADIYGGADQHGAVARSGVDDNDEQNEGRRGGRGGGSSGRGSAAGDGGRRRGGGPGEGGRARASTDPGRVIHVGASRRLIGHALGVRVPARSEQRAPNKTSSRPLPQDDKVVETARRVEDAAKVVIDVLRKYSANDSDGEKGEGDGDNEDDPWMSDPNSIFEEVGRARDGLVAAWGEADDDGGRQHREEAENKGDDGGDAEEKEVRAAYMDLVTKAFAEELDELRTADTDDHIDVDVLVNLLQSGADILTDEERSMLVEDHRKGTRHSPEEAPQGPTPHELHRRELGFVLEDD